jgi:alpha-tubulin suppressor-like RCC1 family protein
LLNDYELVKVETMLAKAVQISVGQSGVALDEEGLVWVWGSN